VSSLGIAASASATRVSDRALGAAFLAIGAALVYLVLFDQGAAAAVLIGAVAGRENTLHELFHDARHFWNAPCH
jgi:ethanolamine utilization microcompartment shell protein EutS